MVKQTVINQLQKNLRNYSADSIQIERIEKGENLVVKSGPFVNQIGRTIEVKGKRIVMLLEQLGIRITVDTTQNRVEKVKKILVKMEE
jgi:transcription antitermination factor NusG